MKSTKLYLSYKVSFSSSLELFIFTSVSEILLATKYFFLTLTWTWENTACITVSLESVDVCVEQLYMALDYLPTWCPAPFLVSQPQNVLVLWLSLPPREPAHPQFVILGFPGGAGVLGCEPIGGHSHFPAALGWLQSWASCACPLSVTTTVTPINLVFLLSCEV